MSSDRSEGGSDSLHDCLLGKSDMTERQEASGRGILAVNVWFLWCCGKIIQQHNIDMLLPEPCPVETSGCRAEIKDWSVGGSLDVHLLKTSCRQVPAVVMVSVLLSQDAVCPGSSHTHITLSLPAHIHSGAAVWGLLVTFSFGMKDTTLLLAQNQHVSDRTLIL